ncbi:MAG: hypothetical protein J07HX5_01458 [halophilic archaeon J07HX5]|nr:MAG: hypothetical protein J07HX5_01458 [halophilic archaeon J07HX5]
MYRRQFMTAASGLLVWNGSRLAGSFVAEGGRLLGLMLTRTTTAQANRADL